MESSMWNHPFTFDIASDINSTTSSSRRDNSSVAANTTLWTTTDTSLPDEYYGPIRDIYFVLIGCIVCVGLTFNTLALAVFGSSKALRSTTTAHYLMALSVADSLCLVTEVFRWLSQVNTFQVDANLLNTSSAMCKGVFVLRYLGHMASAWITVAITTERFITIRFPLKVSRISTTARARIVIGVIFSVCTVFSLYPLYVVDTKEHEGKVICMVVQTKLYEIGLWVTIRLGVLLVPSVIVCSLTAYIIYHLRVRDRLQYQLQPHSKLQRGEARVGLPTSLERQLTGMLLAVAVAFVILRLPYIIMYYINNEKSRIWRPLDLHVKYDIYVAYKLTDVLAVSNYAVNFFLYFVCGSTFRKQLAAMFRWRVSGQRRASLTTGTMSTFFSRRSSTLSNRSSLSKSQLSQISRSASGLREFELQIDACTRQNLNARKFSSHNL